MLLLNATAVFPFFRTMTHIAMFVGASILSPTCCVADYLHKQRQQHQPLQSAVMNYCQRWFSDAMYPVCVLHNI